MMQGEGVMEKKQAYVVVSGIVQGVGYRYFTHKLGNALGVTGWVKNLADGSVEVLIEGAEEDIHQMLARLREGPFCSRVDDMDVRWGDYSGGFMDFSVKF